jgi:hypothetical protein
VGLHHAFARALAGGSGYRRVLFTDPISVNVGRVRHGVRVLHGRRNLEAMRRCDLILVTGSTVVNGTVGPIPRAARRYGTEVPFYERLSRAWPNSWGGRGGARCPRSG